MRLHEATLQIEITNKENVEKDNELENQVCSLFSKCRTDWVIFIIQSEDYNIWPLLTFSVSITFLYYRRKCAEVKSY